MKFANFVLPLLISSIAYGQSTNTSTVVFKSGTVKVFSHPSKSAEGPSPRVLFEEIYYTEKNVKRGDKIGPDEILWTGKRSRAKVIFENGDQIIVPSFSAYKVGWEKARKRKKTEVTLYGGVMRMVIENGGPRKDLNVKSKSIALGVRGTDFIFRSRNAEGASEVSVLRGKVGLWPVDTVNPKPVEVSSGYTANVKVNDDNARRNLSVSVGRTSKTRLQQISTLTATPPAPQSFTRGRQLEKTATRTALRDIQLNQPHFFKKHQKSLEKMSSSSNLDKFVLQKMSIAAKDDDLFRKIVISYKATKDAAKKIPPKPLATEKVTKLAKMEAKVSAAHLWPAFLTGTLTTAAGVMALNEESDNTEVVLSDRETIKKEDKLQRVQQAGRVAAAVGAISLITTYLIGANYTPYQDCQKKLHSLPTGPSRLSAPVKESKARSCINKATEIGWALSWIPVITGFLGSAYVVSEAQQAQTRAAGGLAAISSMGPLVWKNFWHKHQLQDAKVSAHFQVQPMLIGKRLTSGVAITMNF